MTTDTRPRTPSRIRQDSTPQQGGVYIPPPVNGSRYHFELTYVRDGSTLEYDYDPVLAAKFNVLADWWHTDTDTSSINRDKFEHEAYQRILELGTPVIRYIIEDLRDRDGHWFKALRQLSGDDTVDANTRSVERARNAWLAWGKEQGLI